MPPFSILGRDISLQSPTYFIADIAANHNGDLQQAIDLIYSSAEAGADAAKFQNFQARTIVSDHGFNSLRGKFSHQSKWKKSVYETYQQAELPLEWTDVLKETCDKAGIHYFTSPYSLELIDSLTSYVAAWKVGSGDITWHDAIARMAKTGKPLILATGASEMEEVTGAVRVAQQYQVPLALLQCNTNYTAVGTEEKERTLERMRSINLKVLETYRNAFPGVVLGLSDHTLSDTTTVAAVGLFGARIIEKHYTLDNNQEGPDHPFSLNPRRWREMVDAVRAVEKRMAQNMSYNERHAIVSSCVDKEELEACLGDGVKKIEANEMETCVLQRRGVCAAKELPVGHILNAADLIPLRPQLTGSLPPYKAEELLGKALKHEVTFGQALVPEVV